MAGCADSVLALFNGFASYKNQEIRILLPKNRHFQNMVQEKVLSPTDYKNVVELSVNFD